MKGHSLRAAMGGAWLASLLAGCATLHDAGDLDSFLSFENPRYCEPGAPFAALLDSALVYEELAEPDGANEIFEVTLGTLVIPEHWQGHFGTPTLTRTQSTYTVDIPVSGTWHGVPLARLVIVQTLESEGAFHLVFDAPPARVLRAANEAGLDLPPSGLVQRDGNVVDVSIHVQHYGTMTALSC